MTPNYQLVNPFGDWSNCLPDDQKPITPAQQSPFVDDLQSILAREQEVRKRCALEKDIKACGGLRHDEPPVWGKVIEDSQKFEQAVKPMVLPTEVSGTEQCQVTKVETVSTSEPCQPTSPYAQVPLTEPKGHDREVEFMALDFECLFEQLAHVNASDETKELIRLKARYWARQFRAAAYAHGIESILPKVNIGGKLV